MSQSPLAPNTILTGEESDDFLIANLFLFRRPQTAGLLFRYYRVIIERFTKQGYPKDKVEEAVAITWFKLLERVGPLAKVKEADGEALFDPLTIERTTDSPADSPAADSQFQLWLHSEICFRLHDRVRVTSPLPDGLADQNVYEPERAELKQRAAYIHYECYHDKFWNTREVPLSRARSIVYLHLWGDYFPARRSDTPLRKLPRGVERLSPEEQTDFVQRMKELQENWSPCPAIAVYLFERVCDKQHAVDMNKVATDLKVCNATVSRVIHAYRSKVLMTSQKKAKELFNDQG